MKLDERLWWRCQSKEHRLSEVSFPLKLCKFLFGGGSCLDRGVDGAEALSLIEDIQKLLREIKLHLASGRDDGGVFGGPAQEFTLGTGHDPAALKMLSILHVMRIEPAITERDSGPFGQI